MVVKKIFYIYFDFIGEGINCSIYHAGLTPKQRKNSHEMFVRDKVRNFTSIKCYYVFFYCSPNYLIRQSIITWRSLWRHQNLPQILQGFCVVGVCDLLLCNSTFDLHTKSIHICTPKLFSSIRDGYPAPWKKKRVWRDDTLSFLIYIYLLSALGFCVRTVQVDPNFTNMTPQYYLVIFDSIDQCTFSMKNNRWLFLVLFFNYFFFFKFG